MSANEPATDESRRRVIKAGFGAGAAALVWSEPTIKGLVGRPAYASAASGGTCTLPSGTYPLDSNDCAVIGGVTLCVEKVTPGNNFRVVLQDGCTFDNTTTGQIVILDTSGGDEGPVDTTAGSGLTSTTGAINGQVGSLRLESTLVVTCPAP